MKFQILTLLALTFVFPSSAHAAKAELMNAQDKKIGQAEFKEVKEGLQVSVKVSGLTPGFHGMHIHEKGVCAPPDFKSAGGHFNPEGKKHGLGAPEGHHAGDLPDILAAGNGKGNVSFTAPDLSLNGKNAILKPGGAALVIHAKFDDGHTDPSGNSGDRVACGVIK